MIYLTLFFEFFKIGLFAIGGGLATLPYLQKLVDKYPWYDSKMLVDMIAVSESTPGPIGINIATYAGYCAAGIPGSVVATFSIVLPAFFIMLAVTKFLEAFKDNKRVKAAFYGLRPAVTAIIACAAISIIKITLLNIPAFQVENNIAMLFEYKAIALFAVLFVLINKSKAHPVVFIAASAVIGAVFGF